MNQNNFLITFVLSTSFLIESYCAPSNSKNVTVKDYCIKETGISKEKVTKMEDDSLEEPDEDCFCYLHCVFVSIRLIDDKGKLQVKKTMKEFNDSFDEDCLEKVPKIMECTDMAAIDDCEI